MDLKDFLAEALTPQGTTRKGQHFINRLTRVKPMLAYKLQQIRLDPYYMDGVLPAAIQYAVDNWDLYPPCEVDDFLGADE